MESALPRRIHRLIVRSMLVLSGCSGNGPNDSGKPLDSPTDLAQDIGSHRDSMPAGGGVDSLADVAQDIGSYRDSMPAGGGVDSLADVAQDIGSRLDSMPAEGGVDRLVGDEEAGGPSDCLPVCVANLRAACRAPMEGQGSCIFDSDAGIICTSNGVRYITYWADAGKPHRIMITLPDGVTPCFYEDEPVANEIDYYSPAGPLVAVGKYDGSGNLTVTCSDTGQVYRIPAGSLSGPGSGCNTIPADKCTPGTCN